MAQTNSFNCGLGKRAISIACTPNGDITTFVVKQADSIRLMAKPACYTTSSIGKDQMSVAMEYFTHQLTVALLNGTPYRDVLWNISLVIRGTNAQSKCA